MDLIEEMEAMERSALHAAPPAASATAAALATMSTITPAYDALLQQTAFVQTRLKALWTAKHCAGHNSSSNDHGHGHGHGGDGDVRVPFAWVLAKVAYAHDLLLRLAEEYPDGVTEAIVVTELMAQLKRRVRSAPGNTSADSSSSRRSNRKVRGVEDLARVLTDLEEEDDAIPARLLGFDGHKLSMSLEKSSGVELKMYLHQRFRACSALLSAQMQLKSSSAEGFPFQRDRNIVFTNVKVMERRDVGEEDSAANAFSLLPTQFLALRLDTASNPLDRVLSSESISLGRLDQFVKMQDPMVLQQLIVKVKVLDIGAVRPSQTPLYIHRQVLFLGEADSNAVGAGIPSTQQRLAQASHVMILWDEQVALSRLFQVGDELLIFQPYIHVCEDQDTEILHVFSEYSSQQRCVFYMEYGSATVFFVARQETSSSTTNTITTGETSVRIQTQSPLQRFIESEEPPLKYEDIQHDWTNFSLYGLVMSIRVSHGIPLMAAFFYAYYDPKTNGSTNSRLPNAVAGAAGGGGSALSPTLDRAIVSRYYLVVLLQIYNAVSKQTLTVEITGENALKSLRLRPGQTVFMDRLVAVDFRSPAISKAREHGTHSTPAQSSAEATFAFRSAHYTANQPTPGDGRAGLSARSPPPSSIVALCSDWESIFGKQSVLSENSRLVHVNSTQGLLKTRLNQEPRLAASYARSGGTIQRMGIALLERVCITYAGWLIPEMNDHFHLKQYSSDESCERGYSTTCSHKACMRRLELVPTPNSQVGEDELSRSGDYMPKWKCGFCQEIFSGMDETGQTFCTLLLCLDDGSMAQPLYAICHGETVETLLNIPAQDFAQLSLQNKFATLQQSVGRDYRVLLSRCEQRRVAVPTRASSTDASVAMSATVDLRVDLLEPVDAFAAAHQLLQSLKSRR